jgi:hypothetical protein
MLSLDTPIVGPSSIAYHPITYILNHDYSLLSPGNVVE